MGKLFGVLERGRRGYWEFLGNFILGLDGFMRWVGTSRERNSCIGEE